MNRTLQSAVATGLEILADPAVRIPAAQAEGVVSLRTLLTALASGQLAVVETSNGASSLTAPAQAPTATKKARAPRKSKGHVNGAVVGDANPAPTAVQ
jgi:hypothetical protein